MDKSPDAFRTISEVAEALETPAHVLRFWESRFPQIRPVKRAGGRRYYRPADVALLTGIKRLLHDEGMTIRGVQKILREQGIRHVSGLSEEPSPEEAALDAAMVARFDTEPAITPETAEAETASALEAALEDVAEVGMVPEPAMAPEAEPESAPAPAPQDEESAATEAEPSRAAMDWLASLPQTPMERDPEATAPPRRAAPPDDTSSQPTLPFPLPPADTAPGTALRVRQVTGAQVLSVTQGQPGTDEAKTTLAARLRALPAGSLAARREALDGIAARVAALRERLSGPAGR